MNDFSPYAQEELCESQFGRARPPPCQLYLTPSGFPTCPWEKLTSQVKEELYRICVSEVYIAPLRLDVNEKGRAVFAAKPIGASHFVSEYKGNVVSSHSVATYLEDSYSKLGVGCFQWKVENPFRNRSEIIDSTDEKVEHGVARLVNHSRLNPNLIAIRVRYKEEKCVRLALVAKRDIMEGEELLVDYGERRPDVLKANPWLDD
eukprot:GHVN01104840.1.p1 GENE.GHVN01104840.1~~GHVN01104840.1.p1  ORF type:complete len:204 (-),score=33.70 GHVN01104840.1:362-973(-)